MQSTKQFGSCYDKKLMMMKPMMKLIAVNTASKCLACMKGCWDPEFEPSLEEIMDYISMI